MNSKQTEESYIIKIGSVISILKYDNSFSTIEASKDIIEEVMNNTNSMFLQKLYAEITFILAQEYKKKKDMKHYQEYRNKSIETYKLLNLKNLKDTSPILSWLLPEIMHEDVVAKLLE